MSETFSAELAAELARWLDIECKLDIRPLDIRAAFQLERDQYNAREILVRLKAGAPKEARALLGIIDDDIYAEGLKFIFGEAEVGGKVAIISLARLMSDSHQQLKIRAYKEAAHELGHIFGLEHCRRAHCGMRLAATVADVDARPARFCADCSQLLAEAVRAKR